MNLTNELAVLTASQVVKAEHDTVSSTNVSLDTLMGKAGEAVFHYIATHYLPQPTLVICGPGNNGGDGYVVASLLKNHGWPVKVIAAKDKNPAFSASQWTDKILEFSPLSIESGSLIVDGIFGIGLQRKLEGSYAAVVDAINQRAKHIISIDVPSGIHTDTAIALGTAIKAEATVTFNFRKPAHVLLPGRQYCGNIIVQDIGLKSFSEVSVFVNRPSIWQHLYPRPQKTNHKYDRGFLHILGGDEMTGAARLAAEAARRMGTGMVMIACLEKARPIYESECIGVLTRAINSPAGFADDVRASVALLGPGSGRTRFVKDAVLAWLKTSKPCVLDADALFVFKENPAELFNAITGNTILTPHEGEFSRLFQIDGNKIERTLKAASMSGATVLLKGADTVIAAPNGLALVQDHSSAFLASGGTGDVLSGMIASLLGNGLDGISAGAFSTLVHSIIAEKIGLGLIAEDMPSIIPNVLKEILSKD